MSKRTTPTNQTPTMADQLRAAVQGSGLSVYEIAKRTGIPQPVLQRFVSGVRDNIRLDTADKLAALFSMRLTEPRNPAG